MEAVLEVLSSEEIQALEDAAMTERDKLIVRTLADTGIRVGELAKLRTADLTTQGRQQYLRVRGEGSKERLVPVPRLYARLRHYADLGRQWRQPVPPTAHASRSSPRMTTGGSGSMRSRGCRAGSGHSGW